MKLCAGYFTEEIALQNSALEYFNGSHHQLINLGPLVKNHIQRKSVVADKVSEIWCPEAWEMKGLNRLSNECNLELD